MKTKICLACEIPKPLSCYYNTVSPYYDDGHTNWCKDCFKVYHSWRRAERKKAAASRARDFKVEFD
jgi:hypothetical protein